MEPYVMESRNYNCNGVVYAIEATVEDHCEIEKDPEQFIKSRQGSIEITGAADDSDKENFSWAANRKAVKLLIEQYKKRCEQFRDPKVSKKKLWNEILVVFKDFGYTKLARQDLDLKMRNLKKTYTTIKQNNNKKTSTGQGRVTWEYFNDFEEIFKDNKTINIENTIQSFQPAQVTKSIETIQPTYAPSVPSTSKALCPSSEQIRIEELNECSFEPSEDLPVEALLETPNISKTPKRKRCDSETKSSTTPQAVRGRNLYYFRKKQLETEERRIEEIIKLRESIDRNTKAMEDRNDLLREFFRSRLNNA